MFYDVNADKPLKRDGTEWLVITAASVGKPYVTLWERVPDGTQAGVEIDELGARMKLIQNRWYADAQHVRLDMAYSIPKPPITCLQRVAIVFSLTVVTAIGMKLDPFDGKYLIPAVIVAGIIVVVVMIADHIIQSKGGR